MKSSWIFITVSRTTAPQLWNLSGFLLSETVFLCVALVVLELTL